MLVVDHAKAIRLKQVLLGAPESPTPACQVSDAGVFLLYYIEKEMQ